MVVYYLYHDSFPKVGIKKQRYIALRVTLQYIESYPCIVIFIISPDIQPFRPHYIWNQKNDIQHCKWVFASTSNKHYSPKDLNSRKGLDRLL